MRGKAVRDVGEVLVRVTLLLLLIVAPLLSSTEVYASHNTLKMAALLPLSGILLLSVGLARVGSRVSVDRVDLAAIVLAGVLSLSAVLSPSVVSALFGPYNQSTGLLVLLAGLLLLLAARRLSREERALSLALLVIGSAIVALLMLAQQAGVDFVTENLGVPTTGRPQATLGNPIHAGLFTALGLVAAAVLAAGRPRSRLLLGLLGLSAFILGAALILSFSRGAWLGAAGGLVVVAWRSRLLGLRRPGRRPLAAAAAIVAILAIVTLLINPQLGGLTLTGRLLSSDEASQQSGSYRLGLYEVALRGLADRPLLGYGPGNFGIAWQQHVDQGMLEVHPDSWAVDSHSLLFELAATSGVLGLAAFLALGVLAVLAWARPLGGENEPDAWMFALPITAGLALLLSTQHAFLTPLLFFLTGVATPVGGLLGTGEAAAPAVDERVEGQESVSAAMVWWPAGVAALIGLVILVAGGFTGARMVTADVHLLRGILRSDPALLAQSVDEFPYYARPIVERGLLLSRGKTQGQKELAIESFTRALRVEPRNAYVLHVLAATLFDIGDLEGATRRSNESLEAFPLYADARLLRANILLSAGNEEEAVESARQSLAIGVPTAQRFYQAAVITGQVDRTLALEIVDLGLRQYPQDAKLLQLSNAQ